MEKKTALRMRGITKRFGSVVANNNVDLDVYEGEILAVLGENGCGKTTLMNMLAGIYYPDEGKIYKDDKEAVIRSPKDAFDLKIGMIHQHFKLVDLFTAAENIVLGIQEEGKYNLKAVNNRVSEIAEKVGYLSLSCFNRHFTELNGCTPSEWRNLRHEARRTTMIGLAGWERPETADEIESRNRRDGKGNS